MRTLILSAICYLMKKLFYLRLDITKNDEGRYRLEDAVELPKKRRRRVFSTRVLFEEEVKELVEEAETIITKYNITIQDITDCFDLMGKLKHNGYRPDEVLKGSWSLVEQEDINNGTM